MITILRRSVARNICVPTLKVKAQRDLAAKSCLAHNFVIWCPVSKIFYKNDNHIESTCRSQDLGRYLEGQGHSMTLQQNRVRRHNFVIWSRISKLFHRNDHHIETKCRAQHFCPYLKGQGQSATLQQNRVRPITLLFDVRCRKYFTEMITILRRRVAQLLCVQYLFGEHYPVLAGSCYYMYLLHTMSLGLEIEHIFYTPLEVSI